MTLVAFFVLAIMLFLAVVEFKLTTLKGFILVPFALWCGTSSIAERVLGQIITSGVRILVLWRNRHRYADLHADPLVEPGH